MVHDTLQATDAKALHLAYVAIQDNQDEMDIKLKDITQRQLLYIPLMHI